MYTFSIKLNKKLLTQQKYFSNIIFKKILNIFIYIIYMYIFEIFNFRITKKK